MKQIRQSLRIPAVAAWAGPLAIILLVAVIAFTAGRASSHSTFAGPHAGLSERKHFHPVVKRLFAVSSISSNDTGTSTTPDYKNMTEHPACAFFRQGAANVRDEHNWGPYKQCDMDKFQDWLKRARSNCYSCTTGANVCKETPTVLYHQYLNRLHPKLWEGTMLSLKAFLMTQDLSRAHMYIWVPDASLVVVPNKTEEFFQEFSDYITVRRFVYDEAIEGTPFQGDRFFGNGTVFQNHTPATAAYTDIVRLLVLNKYGGMWMDNDVVLYQDISHLLSTSYQFVMRWMNNHIMRMDKNSLLLQRAFQVAKLMPLNHPDFQNSIIDKLCKPNGYYQMLASEYGFTDIYNGCLLRLLLRFNNTGPPDAVLYDMPLGLWDHDWIGCFNSRHNLSDTKWREVATHYLGMHNRYPKDPDTARGTPNPQDSPLSRVTRTVAAFWAACGRKVCTPVDGMSIMAYDGFDAGPPAHHRRLLQQLL